MKDAKTVIGIQYMRFLAAAMVVMHHAFSSGRWSVMAIPQITFGEGGVDIFFIISGFIMFLIGQKEPPAQFVRKRIIRIVPMYWLATMPAFVLMARKVPLGQNLMALAKSLLFVPFIRPITGDIRPLLIPGWTLNYEMFFYVVFTLGLLARNLWVTAVAIVALVLAGLIFHPAGISMAFYTTPVMLEFLAGMGLGWLYTTQKHKAWFSWMWPLLPLGLLGIMLSPYGVPRVLRFGMPAMVALLGLLACEPFLARKPSQIGLRLGDASYSIYLVHTLLLGFAAVFKVFNFAPWSFVPFLLAYSITSILTGLALHVYVEKPLTGMLVRLSAQYFPNRLQVTVDGKGA